MCRRLYKKNTYHFFNFSIERITIILSIWSRCKDVRRSFTMKPVELKHRSTAAEEAGIGVGSYRSRPVPGNGNGNGKVTSYLGTGNFSVTSYFFMVTP